jgi:hypothetical protein
MIPDLPAAARGAGARARWRGCCGPFPGPSPARIFDQDFPRLAVRASEGEVSEQNEGLAFERDRRTMLPPGNPALAQKLNVQHLRLPRDNLARIWM